MKTHTIFYTSVNNITSAGLTSVTAELSIELAFISF